MPTDKRRPRVEFRLENDVYALLQEQVRRLAANGTITTVDQYARALCLSALGQAAQLAFADEVAIAAHNAKRRVGAYIGQLIEENMEGVVEAAQGGTAPEDG